MITSIRILTATELRDPAVHLEEDSIATGWYSIDRLSAEGPYEPIKVFGNVKTFIPEEGPLAKTESEFPRLWCAVSEGSLIFRDKIDDALPQTFLEDRIRGYYDLDIESNKMVWHSIGEPWNENEIHEFRLLSNISYQLYKKVPTHPENIFFFGAGASFGSDSKLLQIEGRLPPLGNNLYPYLRNAPELKHWHNIPEEIENLFNTQTFEVAMEALDKDSNSLAKSFLRDIELSLFFSRYHSKSTNLYWKLARKIARKLKTKNWTGAAITLNYERLLEESFMLNQIFTVVKGITHYDDNIPPLRDDQLFEICYPHGGCQFFFSQTWLKGEGDVIFADTAEMKGNTGANHFLRYSNIPKACEMRQIPLICRYHPCKRASVNNYFIKGQKQRSQELVINAKKITLVGIQCLPNDKHIWEPLSETKAFLLYVEPFPSGQEQFRNWASDCGKIEGKDFKIIPEKFNGAFEEILKFNDL